MDRYVIRGGRRLEGTVRVGGAKNAILPILAATVLNKTDEVIILTNVPHIRDVVKMVDILRSLGAEISWSGGNMIVSTRNLSGFAVSENLMREMRSTIFLMGALLGRCGQVCISHPGGCAIGQRPIELHLKGLRKLGAQVREQHGFIYASCSRLTGAEIHLDYPSVGATENIMMASVYARGVTVISNAAKEPEIVDLQNMLNKMGAKIRGAGTDQIRITGVTQLRGIEYSVIPDRIVAGTLMIAAAATGGECYSRPPGGSHGETQGNGRAGAGRKRQAARGSTGTTAGCGVRPDIALPRFSDRPAGPDNGRPGAGQGDQHHY